jgi:hypothetical protein
VKVLLVSSDSATWNAESACTLWIARSLKPSVAGASRVMSKCGPVSKAPAAGANAQRSAASAPARASATASQQ